MNPTEYLTVNGRSTPLGIPGGNITLGWATISTARGAVQKAYEIHIGTAAGKSDVWNSKRVESARQVGIELPASVQLLPATRYWWQVKTWDAKGAESAWSKPTWFETGLLAGQQWAGAEWISRTETAPDTREWSDYVATVDFTVNAIAFGVLFRASTDGENAYMNQIKLSGPTPQLVIHKKVNGAYSVISSIDLAPFGFTNASLTRDRHKLELDVSGSTLITRLDGQTVDTRTDTTFPNGVIGLRTYGSERATVHKVMVVQKAGGKVLYSSDFAGSPNTFTGGTVVDGAYTISGNTEAVYSLGPVALPLLRGSFVAKKQVRSARVYASAHGVYELSLNGKKVGNQYLAPGWTDYNKRIQSQSYDVTQLVRQGQNVVGASLGDGWYKGKIGVGWKRVYGDTLALIAKVKVTYTDGSVEWFGTNGQWKSANSPRLVADLQDGETYDARLEQAGWNTVAFDAGKWNPVRIVSNDSAKLVPQPDEPVRVSEILTAKSRIAQSGGRYLYDLGQNMVGVARLTLTGKKGQSVQIRYAEELYRTGDRRGQIYTDNFRTAKVTDVYTFAQDGTVTYEPTFTQHGFRYVEISGLDTPPTINEVKGMVRGSALPNTGDLETSNPMLNQLVRNIRWGQRGNFVSIPTDTPARDERLGWTGDISIFAPTASYYQDTRAFLSKWMDDVRDAQRDNGNIPAVVPQPRREFDETGVGWSDAFITVPYAVWKATGDDRIIRQNWEAMQKFYGFVHQSATKDGNLLEEGRSSWFSGDWLNLEGVDRLQEHKVIATAYFAEDTRMMSEMASAIGQNAKSREWAALVPQIGKAFTDAYVQPDGAIYTNTQTVYAMGLGMNLITDSDKRQKASRKFIEKMAADNYHLKTGFLGTPWLLPAFLSIDRPDLAFRLLLNEDYPSWGFEVKTGATTMWERWNTIRDNGEFGPVSMNSFNHYAYGAVGDWMFQHLGGLQAIEAGYKKSRIAPMIGQGGLTSAKATLRTTYGPLSCDWKTSNGGTTLKAVVPSNTTAEIVIPAQSAGSVSEGSSPAISAAGVKSHSFSNGQLTLVVGSGSYVFTVKTTPTTGKK
ncbi:rhamnosidase [bacterium]|nr:MAG: rhamnosidase [bacterium]